MPFRVVPVETALPGLVLIEPRVFTDERGLFLETWHRRDFETLGVDVAFVQDNHSVSRRGTLRGMHFQRTRPQAKLVRVLRGRIRDVVVDLRAGSPTEGRWWGVDLDDERRRMLFIPAGFAHGFLALSETAEVAYKTSDYYRAEDEGGLVWNDPDVGIEWPLEEVGEPLLSEKDARLPRLAELDYRYRGGGTR